MDWNIEIRIPPDEIATFGREQAIARATRIAWYKAASNARPTRSLVLRSTEERAAALGAFDLPGLYLRFRFEVS